MVFCKEAENDNRNDPCREGGPRRESAGFVRFKASIDARSRLAAILVYPGAAPVEPGVADVETEVHFGHHDLREVTATYWTSTPEEIVWDFYRRELPQWLRNLDHHTGKELIDRADDCVRLIRVSTDKQGRTIIETSVKPPGYPDVLEFHRKK
jgi:hypothetical protein